MAIQTIPSTLIADNAISAAKIASGIISADDIADNSLTAAKISASTSPTFGGLTVNNNVTVNTDTNSTFTIADGGADAITLYGGSGDELYIGANAAYKLRFKTDGNIVMDNGGNLGIGTDSPQDALHVKNPTQAVGDAQVILEGRPAGYGTGISFQAQLTGGSLKEMARIVADGSASWNTTTTTQDARLRFFTTNDGTEAERMTIQSNGGVEIGDGTNYGYLKVITNNAASAVFDRRNGDGSLILFRNDDSTDGQINTLSGRIAIGSDDTGIFFDSTRDCVSPFSMNTNDGRGNAIDIGRDAVKFKDLYLSGTADVGDLEPNSEGTYANNHVGVYANGIVVNAASSQAGYLMSAGTGLVRFDAGGAWIRLGGTAAANQLDDYEEGTWNPSLNAGSFSSVNARYTKIGRVVTLTVDATVGTGGGSQISNIPFTAGNTTGTAIYTSGQDFNSGRTVPIVIVGGGSTTMYFRDIGDNVSYLGLALTAGASISFTLTYDV